MELNTLNLLISILCFIGGVWWIIAKVQGNIIFKIFSKLFGIISCILSGHHILMNLNLI